MISTYYTILSPAILICFKNGLTNKRILVLPIKAYFYLGSINYFVQNGQTRDTIFNTTVKSSFARCKGSLKQKMIYLSTVGSYMLLLYYAFH